MIKDYFWQHVDALDLNDIWFQQDGARLRERFPDRVISRNGDVQWQPRSCDITPLDFFLWGYLKSVVYLNKPKTINDLKDNINCAVSDITPDLCKKVTQNWSSRMQFLKNSRGGHLEDIIFK